MKKLIYLSLIAVIVLTGCKQNSFMQQRYTRFAHTHKKPTTSAIITTNANKSYAKILVEKETLKNMEAEHLIAFSNTCTTKKVSLKTKPVFYILNGKNLIQNNINLITKDEIEKTNSVKIEKTFHKKIFKKDGILSTALGLVLSIVVTVIVILLIIFIVLLLV